MGELHVMMATLTSCSSHFQVEAKMNSSFFVFLTAAHRKEVSCLIKE